LAARRLPAAIEGGLVFAGILGAVYLVTKGRGLGLGDVKMAAAVGVFLGYPAALAAAVAAFVIGALLAIPVLAAGSRGRREALPFGPFMVLAALLAAFAPALLFGPASAYQSFLIEHVFRH
jgi:prepilin signal peptidase PulO-like enzyme (type II secretory pathway)